jgi:hypothetical protein
MSEIQQPDTDTQVLEFILGEEQYCVSIDAVNEIVKSSTSLKMLGFARQASRQSLSMAMSFGSWILPGT